MVQNDDAFCEPIMFPGNFTASLQAWQVICTSFHSIDVNHVPLSVSLHINKCFPPDYC